MSTVGRSERNFPFARYFPDGTPQQRAADLQSPLFPGGKSPPRQKDSRLGSLAHRTPTEVFRHQTDLFGLLGGGGNSVGSQGKSLHDYTIRIATAIWDCPFRRCSR